MCRSILKLSSIHMQFCTCSSKYRCRLNMALLPIPRSCIIWLCLECKLDVHEDWYWGTYYSCVVYWTFDTVYISHTSLAQCIMTININIILLFMLCLCVICTVRTLFFFHSMPTSHSHLKLTIKAKTYWVSHCIVLLGKRIMVMFSYIRRMQIISEWYK